MLGCTNVASYDSSLYHGVNSCDRQETVDSTTVPITDTRSYFPLFAVICSRAKARVGSCYALRIEPLTTATTRPYTTSDRRVMRLTTSSSSENFCIFISIWQPGCLLLSTQCKLELWSFLNRGIWIFHQLLYMLLKAHCITTSVKGYIFENCVLPLHWTLTVYKALYKAWSLAHKVLCDIYD